MKVLVTGGAGFIGSEIVKQLRDKTEAEIVVLDALTKQIHGEDPEKSYLYSAIKNKCKFVHGDIRDYSVVKTALSGCNYVIHLAAETGTGQSMYCLLYTSIYMVRFLIMLIMSIYIILSL